MNDVKKLKELAANRQYIKLSYAVLALPDDPPAEHQDLVEMAQEIQFSVYHENGPAMKLANAVIDQFGKKEPRKVECFAVMSGNEIVADEFRSRERAEEYRSEHFQAGGYWIAKVIVTEEV